MDANTFTARFREACTPLPGSFPYTNRRPLRVPGRFDGVSAMVFLRQYHPHVDPETWQAAFATRRLLRREEPLTAETLLRAGDELFHLIPNTVEPDVSIALGLLHMDQHLLVFAKPAPLPLHPCGRFNKNSLLSLLQVAFPEWDLFVVHRLDADTTGVVLLARNRESAKCLQKQFEERRVVKEYRALVRGNVTGELRLDSRIGRKVMARGKREIDDAGDEAVTSCKTLERFPEREQTLLAVFPSSGRTNQIRIHLQGAGFPIVGDSGYDDQPGPRDDSAERAFTRDNAGLCLHAYALTFTHPAYGNRVTYQAPIPDAFFKK